MRKSSTNYYWDVSPGASGPYVLYFRPTDFNNTKKTNQGMHALVNIGIFTKATPSYNTVAYSKK